jgi:hypothetical protein
VVAEIGEVVSVDYTLVEQIHKALAAVVGLEREYLRNIGQRTQEVAADWANSDGIEQMVVQRIEIEGSADIEQVEEWTYRAEHEAESADTEQEESLDCMVAAEVAVVDTEKSVVGLECTFAGGLVGQVIVDIAVEGTDYC